MRIVCPSCTATYEVPERLTASGKRLRCARCAHEWLPPEMAAPRPPPPPPPPLRETPAPASVPLQAERKPRPPARRTPWLPVMLALVASVLVLAGLAAAGFHWRGDIMRVWPPSRLLFATLGAE
jgi:predicted Zn finger-like uncharacterized protein